MMVSIKSNPFFVLKLECNASRRDIASAVEELDFIVGARCQALGGALL